MDRRARFDGRRVRRRWQAPEGPAAEFCRLHRARRRAGNSDARSDAEPSEAHVPRSRSRRATRRERSPKRKLAKVVDDYDIIICDCPPNLQTATQNALYTSDWFFVPMQPNFLSAISLDLLLDRLDCLTEELEFEIKCLGGVFSRVRDHLRFHAETMERLPKETGRRRLHFFKAHIPENIKLSEAPMEAKPIALYDNTATGAEAFRALTAEVLARLDGGARPPGFAPLACGIRTANRGMRGGPATLCMKAGLARVVSVGHSSYRPASNDPRTTPEVRIAMGAPLVAVRRRATVSASSDEAVNSAHL